MIIISGSVSKNPSSTSMRLCFSGLLFVYNALFSTVYAKYLFCLRNEGLDYEPGFEPEFESDNNAGM